MNTFKYFIAYLLCLPMATWAYDLETNGIYYNIVSFDDMTVEVTNGTEPYTGIVVIPQDITYGNKSLRVVRIGTAFRNCTELTQIDMPNSVTSIGESAFYGCNRLTQVQIPNSVITIGNQAFARCTNLSNIDIPNSVTSIGYSAFQDCTALSQIQLPNSIIEIGSSCFSDCTKLTSVTLPKNLTIIKYNTFSGCKALTHISIPRQVESIESNAFANCGLQEITISGNVKSIQHQSFARCANLTSVFIGKNVTEIGTGSFYECTSLTQLVLEDGEEELRKCMYENASNPFELSSLKTLYLGRQTSFYFSNMPLLEQATIGYHACQLGYDMFDKSAMLKEIVFTDSNKELLFDGEGYSKAPQTLSPFKNTPLKTLYWGRTIKYKKSTNQSSYNYFKFSQTLNLEKVTIGKNVEEIGWEFFQGCTSLSDVYCTNPVPCTLIQNGFDNRHYVNTMLHVPYGTSDVYMATENWKNFFHIKEESYSNIQETNLQENKPRIKTRDGFLMIENASSPVEIYTSSGCLIKKITTKDKCMNIPLPKHAIYIIKTGEETTKIRL